MQNNSLQGSNLLGALHEKERALILSHLEPLQLQSGDVIYEPGDDVRYAYFPRHAALVTFLIPMLDGEAVEAVLVGREGAVGGIVSQGDLPAFARCVVQHGGDFFRLATATLDDLKAHSPPLERLFARYADCLVAQLFQSVACNARHSIEQRTAKWLIAATSRTASQTVVLTQAQLGSMLGVGRSYVARVIARMKADGLLDTRRGGLHIHDLTGLRSISCECNALIAGHFNAVLRGVYPS